MKSIVERLNEALNEAKWSQQDLEDYCEMYITPTVEKMGGRYEDSSNIVNPKFESTARFVEYDNVDQKCADKLIKDLSLVKNPSMSLHKYFNTDEFNPDTTYSDQSTRKSSLLTALLYDADKKILVIYALSQK